MKLVALVSVALGLFTIAPALGADLERCVKLRSLLASAQAEYKSDEARLELGTPDQVETKTATLASDQKKIAGIEVQISAEGCPDAKPLVDAPRAIGGEGTTTVDGGKTGPAGQKLGPDGKPLAGEFIRFDGDYDTHTELGLLHLELDDANATSAGFDMQSADYKGPSVPCNDYDRGGRVYRGYFRPDDSYKQVTDYGSCEGVCIIACVGNDGILLGKFGDRTPGGFSKRQGKPQLIGTFTLAPPLPDDRFVLGTYNIMGTVNPGAGTPNAQWQLTRN